MNPWIHRIVLSAALVLVACGQTTTTQPPGGGSTAGRGGDLGVLLDAGALFADAGPVMAYPGWQLEDVQPQSARFNETYGLAAFAGRPLVVVVLEGY